MYQLTAFNLNKPVEVTIIFDDSDEEHMKNVERDRIDNSKTSRECYIEKISKATHSPEKTLKTESHIEKECTRKEIFDTKLTEVIDIFSLSKSNNNGKRVLDDFSLVLEKDEITSPYFSKKKDRIRTTPSPDCFLHENDAKRICLNKNQITTHVSNYNNVTNMPNISENNSNTNPVFNVEEIIKSAQSFEYPIISGSCYEEKCKSIKTFDAKSTEVLDIFSLSKSNNDAKRVLEDFSLFIEKDENNVPQVSNDKDEKRKKSSPNSSILENDAKKRGRLNKDEITTNVLNYNNVPNMLNNSTTYSNTPQDIIRSSIIKNTCKHVAVTLLRLSDTLQRYESSSISEIFDFYLRNYDGNSIINAIENIIYPLEKYADFSSKLINYALVLCNSKFSYDYLLKILNEMVMWVKRNKQLKTNNMICSTSGTQPKINNNGTSSRSIPINKTNSSESKTCIYSNGPPGCEIRITVDPTLLKKHSFEHPNSTYDSTNVTNSKTPANTTKSDTKTTMLSGLKNIRNITHPQPYSKESPLPVNIPKKYFDRNPVPNENRLQPLPNSDINNLQRFVNGVPQSQRTYEHSTHYSQFSQIPSSHEKRDSTLYGHHTGNVTNNQITLNSQEDFQAMYRNSSLPQSSYYNDSNCHSQQNNINRNGTVSNQPAVYNMPGLPYEPARVVLPATTQPQFKESRQFIPQTTRPPPPYIERNHQLGLSIPYQVQQTHTLQNQNVDHSIYHQSQQSKMVPQAPTTYSHPSCYPILRQELNQSVPKPPPRGPQIQTMSGSNNQWINQTRYQNNNIEMQSLQQPSDYRNRTNRELIRSVSTDSGFISPLSFNTPIDKSNDNEFQEALTPLITHVTSLNPDVIYINEGPCSVCAKLTKTKCLGCYNCYYCSMQCQQRDWQNHQNICKTRNELSL